MTLDGKFELFKGKIGQAQAAPCIRFNPSIASLLGQLQNLLVIVNRALVFAQVVISESQVAEGLYFARVVGELPCDQKVALMIINGKGIIPETVIGKPQTAKRQGLIGGIVRSAGRG